MNDVMINIGNENSIPKNAIMAVLFPGSLPVKNMISLYREENRVIDATRNKKTQSVILIDGKSGPYIILSSFSTKTISKRYSDG